MAKENPIELEITDSNHAGEGVGRYNGRVVFVPYGAPGDIALVLINEDRGTYLRAELLSLVRESDLRVTPPCPVYLQCGGCQIQHLNYEAQLKYKENRVRQALERIGNLKGIVVKECIPAPQRFHYRNKARFSYEAAGLPSPMLENSDQGNSMPEGPGRRRSLSRFARAGFYRRCTRDVVDFDECIIQSHTNNRVFQALNQLIPKYEIPVYSPSASRLSGNSSDTGIPGRRIGSLRHLVVRTVSNNAKTHGPRTSSGEALAVLVTHQGPLPRVEELAHALIQRVPELAGVIEDVGGGVFATSITPNAPGPRLILGKQRLTERICGLDFSVSAGSFLQVNPRATEILYGVVLEYAQLTGRERVVDAYSGIGTISLLLARSVEYVWGIESVEEATQDAAENAHLNGIRNCSFITGKVEEVLGRNRDLKADVVVLDPPRPGCEKGAIAGILRLSPQRIVYVSCNPETLARDLARLARAGYRTVEVQPVDMFPQTSHVECVAIIRM